MQEDIEEKNVRLAISSARLTGRVVLEGIRIYRACLFLQAKSQLKAIYKDNCDTIVANMDSQLFLGGSEPSTLKDLSQALGKETIDMYNTGESRGNNPSYSMNYQKAGKD